MLSFKDLRFVEVYGGFFQLNSNRTSKNLFECSSYVLEVEFLKNFDVLEKFSPSMRGGMPSIYSGLKG